jgi:hypothetical protein
MSNIHTLIRKLIGKVEPKETIKVLSKIETPKSDKVFIHCVYVINNISSFSITLQSDYTKKRLADLWGDRISKLIELSLGVEVVYIHNTIISERQYRDMKVKLYEKGFTE